MKKFSLLVFFFYLIFPSFSQDNLLYKNPGLPVETRVRDLLSRMTKEEKFFQLFMVQYDTNGGMERFRNGMCGLQVRKSWNNDANTGKGDHDSFFSAVETARKINSIQKYFVEETRLGIPVIFFEEALHGLMASEATSFPQSIALAATWDTALMSRVAGAIASETESRGIRQVLSPVVNIAGDVRGDGSRKPMAKILSSHHAWELPLFPHLKK